MLMTQDKLFVSMGEVIYFTRSPDRESPPHIPPTLGRKCFLPYGENLDGLEAAERLPLLCSPPPLNNE